MIYEYAIEPAAAVAWVRSRMPFNISMKALVSGRPELCPNFQSSRIGEGNSSKLRRVQMILNFNASWSFLSFSKRR